MTATSPKAMRVDIQLLRAFAVGLVVLFHAHLGELPGGFLGVDVFFVISGYLMTGIIVRELDGCNFSFVGFYARRARRLLPAAYATLTATAAASAWLLPAAEWHAFVAQLAGSFGFVANVVLWRQLDYFNALAGLTPLLHMWSLAVEEQYYLVLPALLVFCPARWRLTANLAVVLASFALCLIAVDRVPAAAFYLAPFRAWELGIGSLIAVLEQRGMLGGRRLIVVRTLAALLLIATPLLADERGHPGWAALAVCIATGVLMLPGLDLKPRRILAPATALGDRSYSLYLVHWPLFALANNVMLAPPSRIPAIALIGVALIGTELQYRLVEQRFRRMRMDARAVAVLVTLPVLLTVASLGWARWAAFDDQARQPNFGLSPKCDVQDNFEFSAECSTGDRPTILVWGDSFAMHLVGGIAASSSTPVAQATRVLCGPFIGLAPVNGTAQPRRWAERCLTFNDSVVAALARAPQVHTVVLSSALVQYVPGQERWQLLVRDTAGARIRNRQDDLAIAALVRTVVALHRLGKRVVLVAPPPAPGYDIGRCAARLAEHKPIVPAMVDCDFATASYQAFREPNLAFLAEIERRAIVPVFRFDPELCPGARCHTMIAGTRLYRDGAHLSVSGSQLLGARLELARRLDEMAR